MVDILNKINQLAPTIAQCPLIERGFFTGGQLERDGRKEGRREQRILEIAKVLVTVYI